MTPAQCKAGRLLLGWSQTKLSAECDLSPTVLNLFERNGHVSRGANGATAKERLAAIRVVLEGAGVEFTNGDAPGVRLKTVGMTPVQAVGARLMLGWSRERLARAAKLTAHAVQRFERLDQPIEAATDDPGGDIAKSIRAAFELAGVEFIERNGGGPGVRLRWPSRAEDFEDVPYARQPAIAER